MKILILGGDGYIGWPLAVRLATRFPTASITIVDNFSRRRLVAKCGGNSVTPIEEPAFRLASVRQVYPIQNLSFVEADVTTSELDGLLEELRPTVVYHLAQQCSAPYSMMGMEEALFTLHNNETGNLRLLWAMRRYVPEAHLIKLGTFGEYCKAGIDIAEGYFEPTYQGKVANRPMPYPREADDIYHISKINDSNYLSLACRTWGLRATDVMQSTVFGVCTAETFQRPSLYTRFDYDSVWGTVVNRFVAQTICGHPMTVYGTGHQRTGLMALEDAVESLAGLATMPAETGEHRVINHVTERDLCVNEIAEAVAQVAEERGFHPTIHRRYNPRGENDPQKPEHYIENHYVASYVAHTPFKLALSALFESIVGFRHRIRPEVFPPQVEWAGS